VTRVRFVLARRTEGFAVQAACEAAQLARSTFYHHAARLDGDEDVTETPVVRTLPAARAAQEQPRGELDDDGLTDLIVEIHDESGETAGRRPITAELAARGHRVNHTRVGRLMAAAEISSIIRQRRILLTKPDPGAPPLPDVVRGQFDPPELDLVWVSDLTYLWTVEGWLYFATIMDLVSRRVIGWALGNHHDTQLVLDALHSAMATRGRRAMGGRTIFHSDRGGDFTTKRFRRACKAFGLRQSAGRTGSCLDNAAAESLFASFKVEQVHRDGLYATRADARLAATRWLVRYNHRRRHWTIEYRTCQHRLKTGQLPTGWVPGVPYSAGVDNLGSGTPWTRGGHASRRRGGMARDAPGSSFVFPQIRGTGRDSTGP
jgi:putative transposase